MEEAGYAVSPAPVRVNDGAAKRAYTAAITVVALVCYLFFNQYPMDWQVLEAPSGDSTGRVLYDHKGVSYESGYHYLGTMTTSGWLGPSENLYAAFSLPSRGENHRGYLIYDTTATSVPPASISSYFNYVHQYSRLQFPVQTAMQREANGSPNLEWGFFTAKTEFRINTFGDFPCSYE